MNVDVMDANSPVLILSQFVYPILQHDYLSPVSHSVFPSIQSHNLVLSVFVTMVVVVAAVPHHLAVVVVPVVAHNDIVHMGRRNHKQHSSVTSIHHSTTYCNSHCPLSNELTVASNKHRVH